MTLSIITHRRAQVINHENGFCGNPECGRPLGIKLIGMAIRMTEAGEGDKKVGILCKGCHEKLKAGELKVHIPRKKSAEEISLAKDIIDTCRLVGESLDQEQDVDEHKDAMKGAYEMHRQKSKEWPSRSLMVLEAVIDGELRVIDREGRQVLVEMPSGEPFKRGLYPYNYFKS